MPEPQRSYTREDDEGNKIFVIPSDKWEEMKAWLREHQEECRQPEFTDTFMTAQYRITFRPSGLSDNPMIVCDCGEEFYSKAGDDYL